MRIAFLFVLMCLLSACASKEIIIPLAAEDPRVAAIKNIHVASLRAPSNQALSIYSGERSENLNFGEFKISIPKNRQPGVITYPRVSADVEKQFATTGYTINKSDVEFVQSINAELATKSEENQSLFVFVHGYNNNFASGMFRQAQIFHDFKFSGVAVNFSWASAGKLPLYLYDRDSAQLARTGLRNTLKLLAKTNARKITLIGHSMGGFVTMEALREMGIRNETDALMRIDALILASPDIDKGVFREQLSEINPLPQPFVIFVSKNDRALQASQKLRGGQVRVGEGTDIKELQGMGITVVDLSDLDDGQDAANHNTFASSKTVLKMVETGALGNKVLHGSDEPKNALKPIGDGLGNLTDLAAAIVYLPAKIAGVR